MRTGFRSYQHLLLLALPIFLLFAAPLAEGATIYVDSGSGGANNGTSWADAHTDLQAALAASVSGDDIWVATGTYMPTAGADRTISFVLKNGVALYGGFAGTETSLGQRNWTVNITILSGNIGAPGTNADNSYSVVNGSNTNSTAVLDGFFITGGNANGVPDELQRGGGMIVYNGSPTVRNCTFDQNNAANNGGGMYINDGAPVVTNCTFSSNSAANGAGMTNINNGSPIVTDCVFSQNNATNVGGGMFNAYGGNPTVTNCAFSQNNASLGGGMRTTENSAPTVTGSLFSGNTAGHGGGMYNSNGGNPVITGSTFSDNVANIVGGGMYNADGGDAVVTNCTFSGNSATFSGGGMRNNNSNPVVTNSTFSGNSAANEGGGLYNAAGSAVVLMNCTFFENTASHGAGIFNDASNPVVTNTIFWSAGTTTGQIYNQNAAAPVIAYSITDQSGTGNIAGDPRLGPLADNGGTTRTHALLDGSAALDAGTSAGAPAADQRGVARPQGAGIDIGSFEKAAAPGGSGGGCSVGFSPWTLLFLLPLSFLTRR